MIVHGFFFQTGFHGVGFHVTLAVKMLKQLSCDCCHFLQDENHFIKTCTLAVETKIEKKCKNISLKHVPKQ